MTASKGRKPPIVTVRKPPELPKIEELDPSATAAFVEGKPKDDVKAPVHQEPEVPSHQGIDALVPQVMEVPAAEASEPAEVPPDASEALKAREKEIETSGVSAPKYQVAKASKHQSTKAPKQPGKGRGLVERAGGKAARRVVAYLDPATAKKLAIRALNEDTDMSALINEAVRRFMIVV